MHMYILDNSIQIRWIHFTDDSDVDIPIFQSEEGRYLASCKCMAFLRYKGFFYKSQCNNTYHFFSALGDPLIKGLTEVANARPKDPVTYLATYLYNFASKNKTGPVNVLSLRDEIFHKYPAYKNYFALIVLLTSGIRCSHYTRPRRGEFRTSQHRRGRWLSSESRFGRT